MIILEAGINHFGRTTEAKKLLNFFLNSNFNHLTFMIHTSKFYEDFKNKIDFELKNEFYEKALYLAHKKKKKIGVAVCDPVSFKKFSNIKFDFYKLLLFPINFFLNQFYPVTNLFGHLIKIFQFLRIDLVKKIHFF